MRLVDADTLIPLMESRQRIPGKSRHEIYGDDRIRWDVWDDAIDLVEGMEEIDTVKHGHWIFGSDYGHSWMKCSECCVLQSGQTACWTYCPNCGAMLDEDVQYETD